MSSMVYELPLFPLNTVLFPGMPLTLHIFEERYKEMIAKCLQEDAPFGVVLIREGQEAMGPLAEPYEVGCTAEIAHVEPLDDGRMNIVAVGEQRFQIVSLLRDQSYLRGAVEPFPLQALATAEAKAVGQLLLPRLENYLTLLSRAGNVDFDASALPNDPESLAYLAATVLQIPNAQKQSLLSMTEATAMLKDMEQRYRRELPVLRLMLQEEVAVPMGPAPFSLN